MSTNYDHTNLFSFSHFMIFILSLSFFQSYANDNSPSIICKNTPFPNFCKSIFPKKWNNVTSKHNVYDYGRFSVHKSLSTTRKFISLVQKHLRK
ncbi:hypothetical protein P3S67_032386 [Capsicum chacoense]